MIPQGIREKIAAALAEIEREHDVRLLLAVESGSRAWGFPSPDSDYDVRFLYVRRRDWYLSLTPGPDVIQKPIVDDIDLAGWDIRKALLLLLKSNATVNEWMESPIRYRPDDPAMARLSALAQDVLNPRALANHYAALGRNAAARWMDTEEPIPVKRYFYALRPALAIRCLRLDPGRPLPMNLQALMSLADLPAALERGIHELVEAKKRTNEQSNTARLGEIDALIRDELGRAVELPVHRADSQARSCVDAFFLELVSEDPRAGG